MKYILGIGALGVVAIGLVLWGVVEGDQTTKTLNTAGITYFWGAECPHCKVVNDFLEANKIAEKVTFEKLEVWHDRGNAKLMQEAANACKLDPKSVGVPFVYADGKCFIGENEAMDLFKQKAGI